MSPPLLYRNNIEPLFRDTFRFLEREMISDPAVLASIREELIDPISKATMPFITANQGGLPDHRAIQNIVAIADSFFVPGMSDKFKITLQKDAQKVLNRAEHVAILRNTPFRAPGMPSEETCASRPFIALLHACDRIAYCLSVGKLDVIQPDSAEFSKARELVESLSTTSPLMIGDLFGTMWNTHFDDTTRQKALELKDPDYCRHNFHHHPIAFVKALQDILETPLLGAEYSKYRNCLLGMQSAEQFLNRNTAFTVNFDPERLNTWLAEMMARLPQEVRNQVYGELYANLSAADKAKAEGHPTYCEENYTAHISELQRAIHSIVPHELLVAERSRLYLATLSQIEGLDFSEIAPVAVEKIKVTRNLLRIVVMNAIERGFCHLVNDNFGIVKSIVKKKLADNPDATTSVVIDEATAYMCWQQELIESKQIYHLRHEQINLINLRNRLSVALEAHSYEGYSKVKITQPGYVSKKISLAEWQAAERNKEGKPHLVKIDLIDAKEILFTIGAYFGKEIVDMLKSDFYNRVKVRATEQKDEPLLQEMASDPDWATHHLEDKRFQDTFNSCGLNLIDKCTVQQLKGTSPAAKKLFEWLTQASGSKGILDDKVFQVNSLRAENFLLDISSGAQVAMVELFLTQAFGV